MAESKPSDEPSPPSPDSQPPSQPPAHAKRPPRTHYISNFKSSLTALVILHHTSLVYGGLGSTLYTSAHIAPSSSATLVGLNLLNQSFFMSSFMCIGGHHSAKALSRKRTGRFIFDRLYRLALPSVAYTIFIHPVSYAIVAAARGQVYGRSELKAYWTALRGLRGPVWFTGTLCAFDVGLAVYRHLHLKASKSNTTSSSSNPEDANLELETTSASSQPVHRTTLLAALAALSAIEFLLRCRHSLLSAHAYFAPLSLNLGYAPQYLAAYALGASSPTLLSILPDRVTATYLAAVSLGSTAILAGAIAADPGAISLIGGGWNLLAATYAVWGNFTGYLVGTGVLGWFAERGRGNWGRVDELAYLAFLCHVPVSTGVEVLVEGWTAGPVLKTAFVGVVNVVASWGVAWVWDAVWRRLQAVVVRADQNMIK